MSSRLLFDGRGRLHLIYFTGHLKLKHARLEKDGWKKQVIDRARGSGTVVIDAEFDRSDLLHLVYVDWNMVSSSVKYARLSGEGEWTTQVVSAEGNPGWKSSLALVRGEPVLSYVSTRDNEILLARLKDGKWVESRFLDLGNNHALTTARDGSLVIAYQYLAGRVQGTGTLLYARQRGEEWESFIIEPRRGVASYLDLALRSDDRPVIAYFDGKMKALKIYRE